MIPQPLIRPVRMAAFLLRGLSLLTGRDAAAAVAAENKVNEPGRHQCNEDAERHGEIGAGYFVCVLC